MNKGEKVDKTFYSVESNGDQVVIHFPDLPTDIGQIPLKTIVRSFTGMKLMSHISIKYLYYILGRFRWLDQLIQDFNQGLGSTDPYFLQFIKYQMMQAVSAFGYQVPAHTRLSVPGLRELLAEIEFKYGLSMNKTFYLKYHYGPVKVETHFDKLKRKRESPLEDVADLVAAFFPNSLPKELAQYTLHLPQGYSRTALEEDCFMSIDDQDTSLDVGCPLSALGDIGTRSKKPLIIRYKQAIYDNIAVYSKENDKIGVDPGTYSNFDTVPMSIIKLYEWLCSSNTNSASDLNQDQLFSHDEFPEIEFPLAGRDTSLQHIAHCFTKTFRNRFVGDRMERPIPICTGIPGLGKTRLLRECPTTVLDMTGIPGQRVSTIISFAHEGTSYTKNIDEYLGIQCSFAWRLLHSFFKANYSFSTWMYEKSPRNRKALTLNLVLGILEYHFRPKLDAQENLLVFVGIDEYQKLGQHNLDLLIDSLCDLSKRPLQSKVVFFTMLTGTDLYMTRLVRTSHPNTMRTPIRFLTHEEAMKAIGPYLSKAHFGFVVNDTFSQNVFYLGGDPRLLTEFAKQLVHIKTEDIHLKVRSIRKAVLANYRFPDLSTPDILKLLAVSFSNTNIRNELDTPFDYPNAMSWNQLISMGTCLLQEDGSIIVPFHLVGLIEDLDELELCRLNEYEKALALALKDLSCIPIPRLPIWLSWESFGAHFYCIRINAFLVLGRETVPMSKLLQGAQFSNGTFNVDVVLKVARVVCSVETYGPELPPSITCKNSTYQSICWTNNDKNTWIVMNGENGVGVDLFFTLEPVGETGTLLILDQRKRVSSNMTLSSILAIQSKVPETPRCLKSPIRVILGIVNVFSEIKIDPIPESTFLVSRLDSLAFHGSLFDHPGCSTKIDVNTASCTALSQLYQGSGKSRKEMADKTIEHRKRAKFKDLNDLELIMETRFDHAARSRICF